MSRKPIKIKINKKIIKGHTTPITAIDLFCGCGGLSKGLSNAGIEVLAGIDHWDKAIDTYTANNNHIGLCRDLENYPPEQFENETGITSIDILAGGPPCQGFSIAGKRDVKDPRNSLFIQYVKYLNHYNPKVFIMENVMGILSMKTSEGLKSIDIIISFLEKDYNIIINRLYASDFGVPQNRRRVVIIGIRKDLNVKPHKLIPATDRPPVKTVLEPRENISSNYYLSQRAMDGIVRKRERSKKEGNGFGAQFLDLDKPSYTIPARYWKDGYDALVKYDEKNIRRLTIDELKRIQSFPDSYKFSGSKKEIIMQIGNAVAVEFGRHLGLYLLKIFEGIR